MRNYGDRDRDKHPGSTPNNGQSCPVAAARWRPARKALASRTSFTKRHSRCKSCRRHLTGPSGQVATATPPANAHPEDVAALQPPPYPPCRTGSRARSQASVPVYKSAPQLPPRPSHVLLAKHPLAIPFAVIPQTTRASHLSCWPAKHAPHVQSQFIKALCSSPLPASTTRPTGQAAELPSRLPGVRQYCPVQSPSPLTRPAGQAADHHVHRLAERHAAQRVVVQHAAEPHVRAGELLRTEGAGGAGVRGQRGAEALNEPTFRERLRPSTERDAPQVAAARGENATRPAPPAGSAACGKGTAVRATAAMKLRS